MAKRKNPMTDEPEMLCDEKKCNNPKVKRGDWGCGNKNTITKKPEPHIPREFTGDHDKWLKDINKREKADDTGEKIVTPHQAYDREINKK